MRVLFLTPVTEGSGETITALHMADDLVANGHHCFFIASSFAQHFIKSQYPESVLSLTDDSVENHRLWDVALETFRPDIVVLADYPLMFMPRGTSPLASNDEWLRSLEDIDAELVTLDHFGFAQHESGFFLGPPHLGFHWQEFPRLPPRMHVLLPVPMHEPGPVAGRKGTPFRYWNVPLSLPQEVMQAVRARYLEGVNGFLVFHLVSNWAWRYAEATNLSYYHFLPYILDDYFGPLSDPVTIVSVNNGHLLKPSPDLRLRFVNLGPVSKEQFEELLFGSHLVITENKLSISIGKAICGLQPCAVLGNRYRLLQLMPRLEGRLRQVVLSMENLRLGSVYPYEVFPNVTPQDLEAIGLYRNNSLTTGFRQLEVYGGEETAEALQRLLTDEDEREALQKNQLEYIEAVQRLDGSSQVLAKLLEKDRKT